MLTKTVVPNDTIKNALKASISIFRDLPGIPGTRDTVVHLTTMCTQNEWEPKNIRMAWTSIRSYHTLLAHQADPNYWMLQMTMPSETINDNYTELAIQLSQQRYHQAQTLRDTLEQLKPYVESN